MKIPYRYRITPRKGNPPKLGPQLTELVSQEELAGEAPLPTVELIPRSPPLEIIECYPSPLPPPPPPITRETTLPRLQIGFAALTVDELKIAHLWLVGSPREDIGDQIGMSEDEVRRLWQNMRYKLRLALEGEEPKDLPPRKKNKE